MSRLKVAFVGAGGGARGLSHLGVLKACEELGIRPEIFVGTNVGALVSATYGQDIPLDVLLDPFRLPWRRRHDGPHLKMRTFLGRPKLRDFLDPGYLAAGLFSIDAVERYLARFLPINDFRKLPNPVFVTAVDVDSGKRVVFGPGPLEGVPVSQALAASFCVPGLFRPYRIGQRHFVDGEMHGSLPADVAVAAGAAVVILSSTHRPRELPSGKSRSVARRGGLAVLEQSVNVALHEAERRELEILQKTYPHVTFLDVRPDVGSFSTLNRYAARPLVLRGYHTGLRTLTAAKERGVFDEPVRSAIRLN